MFKIINGENFKEYIDIKKLPLLILDSTWIRMFPEERKSEEIKKSERRLRAMICEQGQLYNDNKQLYINKKALLSRMLSFSDDVRANPTSANKRLLDQMQKKVGEINNKMDKISKRLEELPKEIEEENNRLFQICLKNSYNTMNKNLKEANKITPTIEYLREQLSIETEKKKKLEENYRLSTDFLEHYIGHSGITMLNKKYKGHI